MRRKNIGRQIAAAILLGVSFFSFEPLVMAEGFISRILFFQGRENGDSANERTTKDLLRQAIDKAIHEVSQVNGFYHQPDLRIDIPSNVKGIEKISKKLNADLFWHDFQMGLNRAAESAAPKVGVLIKGALDDLKFEKKPEQILMEEGSLTQYFRRKMESRLLQDFRHEIERSVSSQTALQGYIEFKALYASLPFVKNSEAVFDLENEVSRKALEGIFSKIEEEENRLRLSAPERGKAA